MQTERLEHFPELSVYRGKYSVVNCYPTLRLRIYIEICNFLKNIKRDSIYTWPEIAYELNESARNLKGTNCIYYFFFKLLLSLHNNVFH